MSDRKKVAAGVGLALVVLLAVVLVGFGGGVGEQGGEVAGAASQPSSAAAATPGPEAASVAEAPKPYGVAAGVIVTRTGGLGETISETYFEDFGRRQAVYTTTKLTMMGHEETSRSVTIHADGWQIEYDPDTREGKRFRTPTFTGGSVPAMPDIAGLSEAQLTEMQVEELAPVTVLGRTAPGMGMTVAGMKMRAWMWEGIPLRSEIYMGEEPMVMEVTKLDLGVSVPADKFVVPADVKLVTY